MANPTKLVVDCSTGETAEVELTKAEIAQMKKDAEAYAEAKALEDQKNAERKELKISAYKKLGLTDEEIEAVI